MPQSPLGKIFAALMVPTGQNTPVICDASGRLITAPSALPDSYGAAYAGSVGVGGNQAGAVLSAALAAVYTGLCLSNPAGSGKNLILMNVAGVLNVAPTALTAIGLITGFAAGGVTVHTTPMVVQSAKIATGAGAGLVAKLDAACTLVGAPIWSDWLSETPTATGVLTFSRAYAGSIIIPPGGYAAVGASIAGPAAGFLGSMRWQEAPV